MPEPLYLSLWLRGFATLAMPSILEKALQRFPVSRLAPQAVLRVTAIDPGEAPLLETSFADARATAPIRRAAEEFLHEDCAFTVEMLWDLWQWDGAWRLRPAPVALDLFGPRFVTDCGEHIRVDLGAETVFLPAAEVPRQRVPLQSNVRSILHLSADLAAVLPVERKLLWSESGGDFAVRLEAALH